MNNYTVSSKELAQGFCKILAEATVAYDRGEPIMSDEEWDNMYFEVKKWMEEHPGELEDTCLDRIYFKEVSKLNKVEHNHIMASLDKTKNLEEIKVFCSNKDCIAMLKMDGLTCSLLYKNGKLVRAETRGNGYIGEDITHNARVIPSIPKYIGYKGTLVVDGEVICKYDDFEPFAAQYKNPRNFAAGSIRLLNSEESYSRHLTFVAWDCIWDKDDFNDEWLMCDLENLKSNGFITVPYCCLPYHSLEDTISFLKQEAKKLFYPIDGLVFKYNDGAYYNSLGATSHHPLGAKAFKFYDETYKTTLRDIEWTMGRTGVLTPVAIFDEVDTGDSIVTRANLHNISIMNELYPHQWCTGMKLEIYLANMIIPQVKSVAVPESHANRLDPPKVCPICGGNTEIRQINDSKELVCTNPECNGILINRLDHFASKRGLNIKGLSKATLEKLIDWNWVNKLQDIYTLSLHSEDWYKKPGFGKKSVDNILAAIEASRNCTLDKFITAIGIPLIGSNIAKDIAKRVYDYGEFRDKVVDKYPFYEWDGFGAERATALWNFDYTEADEVFHYLHIPEKQIEPKDKTLEGKSFVITGRLQLIENRQKLITIVEEKGGKVTSSISSKTNFLVTNDKNSSSTKMLKAKEFNIPIISEKELLKMCNYNI